MPELDFEQLDGLIRQLPYGPDLWSAVRRWPNSAVGRLNTVTALWEFSCNAEGTDKWIVLAETLLPAIGEFWLGMVDFDWDDIARNFFRPTGLRYRFKFREGKKRSRKSKLAKAWRYFFPEISELVAAKLPLAGFFRGRKVGNAQRWLWIIDGVAQRVLYNWLLIDLGIDFAYNTTFNLITNPRCWKGGGGWFQGGPGFLGTTADNIPRPTGAPMPQARGGEDPPSGVPVYVRPGESVTLGCFATQFRSLLNRTQGFSLWIEKSTSEDGPGVRVGFGSEMLYENRDDYGLAALATVENDTAEGFWLKPYVVAYSVLPDALYITDFTVFCRKNV
jgi:hypothetical protein